MSRSISSARKFVITDEEFRFCTEGKIAASNCLLNQLSVQLTVAILELTRKTIKDEKKMYLFIFNVMKSEFILLDHFIKILSAYFDWAGQVFEANKWSAGKANIN